MTWKVAGWELPSSVYCIIREMNIKTGQVKEHTYQRKHAARAKIEELLSTPDTEFVVADNESIHHLFPGDYDELDDDDDE